MRRCSSKRRRGLWAMMLAGVVGAVVLTPAVGTAGSGAVSQQEIDVFDVTVQGSGAGGVIQSPDDPTPSPPPRISCQKGSGNVPDSGTCAIADSGDQPFPRIVGLLAVTPGESRFAGWAVYPEDTPHYGCGSEPECWVLAEEGVLVAAVFEYVPGEQPLTVVRRGPDAANGSVVSMPTGVQCSSAGRGDCQGNFRPGTQVRLEAKPGPNGSFGGWSGPCRPSEDIATVCVATIPVSGNITATFNTAVEKLTVVADGDGYVASEVQPGVSCPETCEASLARNAVVSLTAWPYAGARFTGWQGADCTGVECSVTMNQSKTVTATFEAAPVQATMFLTRPLKYGVNLRLRAVLVGLSSTEEVDLVIRIRRNNVTLATRRINDFGPDNELVFVNLRALIPAGRAIVQTTFVNDADTVKTQRRAIRIPRR